MRLHIAAVAAIFFIFGKASAQSSQGPQGTVSGHLYCADSQTPCRPAGSFIQSAPPIRDGKPVASDAPSHSYSSATDIDGAYQMSGVVPGECYALGKLQGYLSAYDLAVSMYSGDSLLSAQALEIALSGGSGRPRAIAGRHCCSSGYARNWQPTLLALVVAPR